MIIIKTTSCSDVIRPPHLQCTCGKETQTQLEYPWDREKKEEQEMWNGEQVLSTFKWKYVSRSMEAEKELPRPIQHMRKLLEIEAWGHTGMVQQNLA